MPVDNTLINESTKYSIERLNKKTGTDCPYIFLLDDFLYSSLINKLYNYCISPDSENEWHDQEAFGTIKKYKKNRKKINWVSDSVIEETHVILDNLTPYLNSEFKRNNKFLGLSLWKDISGFEIEKHIDNPQIDISLQIYLNSCTEYLGTKFEYNDNVLMTKYVSNSGYLMDNLGKVAHYFDDDIPDDFTRYSLYGIWTNQTTSS